MVDALVDAAQRLLDDERTMAQGKHLPERLDDLDDASRGSLMKHAHAALDAESTEDAAEAMWSCVPRPRWMRSFGEIPAPARDWHLHRARVARGEQVLDEAKGTLF